MTGHFDCNLYTSTTKWSAKVVGGTYKGPKRCLALPAMFPNPFLTVVVIALFWSGMANPAMLCAYPREGL